ncbi:MAG: transglutaminase domain-containing protein [Oscillospiraceae bacterium]|nr:transglutaminase domain-containing protein [Oscillospiraceae bacterium]
MHAFFSKENIKRKALPFLFTTVLMASLSNLYTDSALSLYTMLSALIVLGVFAMCDFMMKHKKLAVPVYLLAMFTTGFVMLSVMSLAPRRIEFFEWFMTGGETIDTIPQFMLPVVIGFSFFLSSVSYYFSHVIYRAAIFTLISLIPCAIYVKAAQVVPTVLISLIAMLNIFIFIAHRRQEHSKKHILKGAYGMTAYTDFAVAAVLIALLLPKPSVTPYYEKFEEFSNRFAFWGKTSGMTGEYMEHSGNADNYQELESKLIYNVYTDTPQYFRIQVFDKYDPENRWWTASGRLGGEVMQWETNASQQNLTSLYKLYSQSQSDILDRQNSNAADFEKDSLKYARVQAVDFPSQFIIAPSRTAKAALTDRPNETILRSSGYEVFPASSSVRSNGLFDLNYYDENYAESSGWLSSGLCDMTAEEFDALLTELLEYLVYETEDYKDDPLFRTAKAYAEESKQAAYFSASKYEPVSAEIQRLSDEITAGLVYDYEKAAALEAYFNEAGFIYDLGYRAEAALDTPEYFLTQSKRGSCSDFATAFCLLARGAGLTVRYVEGFICRPSETYAGLYEIRTEDAHAYAEVYIPGAGWITYDAAAVDRTENTGDDASDSENTEPDFLTIFIICLAIFISLAAVILLIAFMPVIERAVFSLRLKTLPPEKGIILIYGRLSSTVERLCDKETAPMTSAQLGEYVLSYTGISADSIILPFEKVCYGGLSAEKADIEIADRLHKDITAEIKRINKEKRKTKN